MVAVPSDPAMAEGVYADEEMEVVRLQSEPEEVEVTFRSFGDKQVLKALGNRPKEHRATTPGYADDVLAQERYGAAKLEGAVCIGFCHRLSIQEHLYHFKPTECGFRESP